MSYKSYKGFSKNMTCRGFHYKEGGFYKEKRAVACITGFHACRRPIDVFQYYAPNKSYYHKVTQSGYVDMSSRDSKIASTEIAIEERVGISDIVRDTIEFDSIDVDTRERAVSANNTHNKSSFNSGDRSVAASTGELSVARTCGECSISCSTRFYSAVSSDGYGSAACSVGDCSAAETNGKFGVSVSLGDYSIASSNGYGGMAVATGSSGHATSTGLNSAAVASSAFSSADVACADSVAVALGYNSAAKGVLGSWLVLTERQMTGEIVDIKVVKVDGKIIKEDTPYILTGGVVVETV